MKIDFKKKAEFESYLDKSINDCKDEVEQHKRALETDTNYWTEVNVCLSETKQRLEQLETISKAFYKIIT